MNKNDYTPENDISKIIRDLQNYKYYSSISGKKKFYLPKYLVDKAGGVERIERTFDYQYEVVIMPDAYETVAQGSD